MHVAQLFRHPVKGLRREELTQADLAVEGMAHDRRWMIIDDNGHALSQRQLAPMALIRAEAKGNAIHLPDIWPDVIAWPETGSEVGAILWGTSVTLRLVAAPISAALSDHLGQKVRLGVQIAPQARLAPLPDGKSPVNLADEYPLLLTSTASLHALNQELPAPIEMTRFRPNIVIDGAMPWDEDGWLRLKIGDCVIRITQHCKRCIVTTIDPETATRPDRTEPLRTLARLRAHTGAPNFGVQAIIEQTGTIHVGDQVEILDRLG